MRRAVLYLAFDGLGALRAESDAFADNTSSIGVSRSLGYRDNGTMFAPRPSGAALMLRFVMTPAEWNLVPHDDMTISGLHGAVAVLGVPTAP
jgi:RimJ/RimL family protein N-acetyltransferase